MKLIRYESSDGATHYAALESDGTARRIHGDPFGRYSLADEPAEIARLLASVVPSQIFCIGLNYRQHAEESGLPIPAQPVVFMKGVNAVQHPGAPIALPRSLVSTEVDYEAELAVVIGRACKNASRTNALDYVLGYTCGNDVSARDWQLRRGGGQWCRGKTFDTFCPLGPCLVTREEIPDPNALQLRTTIGSETLQDWNTSDMIFTVAELIVFLSGSTTLLPGTVILTGTPHGVGMARKPPRWLCVGDSIAIEIEKIGRLENPVCEETMEVCHDRP